MRLGAVGATRACLLVAGVLLLVAGCGSSTKPSLSATPAATLWDQPVSIVVKGAKPHALVLLHASAVDMFGAQYGSSTTARADGSGRVDLRGNAAMRLIWTLQPKSGPPYYYVPRGWTAHVTISARVRGNALRAVLDRQGKATGIRGRRLTVAHDGLDGDLFTPPASERRRAGVLVFGGSEGGLYTVQEGALLASHGYTTIALAYFHAPGLPKDLHDIPLEYFARALHILARQPGVDPKRLAVYGISYGGQAAQLLGIHYPRLVHAVVALVAANGSWCGIPAYHGQSVSCLGAAWSFGGKPVPYDKYPDPYHTEPQFPDEQINGPVFLVCGQLDRFGSCGTEQAIVARLHAHHFAHRVTFLDYPNVGHGIGGLIPYTPEYEGLIDGPNPDANQRARAQGWPKLLQFLAGV